MNTQPATNPFDDCLLAWLSRETDSPDALPEREAQVALAKTYGDTLSADAASRLLNRVQGSLSAASLGRLLQQAGKINAMSEVAMQKRSGFAPALLGEILADRIFPNSIPIKSLVALVRGLQLPLDAVREAIRQTFRLLTTENRLPPLTPGAAAPAYRRSYTLEEPGFDYGHLQPGESYLYQNQEALERYLARLEDLYNKD